VIIRDNDSKFGTEFNRVAKGAGMNVVRTAVKSPLMNARCERFLESVKRECQDHVIILSEAHLKRVLDEWDVHFNRGRPHQGLEQRVPVPPDHGMSSANGKVVAFPILSGLHHEYRRGHTLQ
jgi:transposase InsO family protein